MPDVNQIDIALPQSGGLNVLYIRADLDASGPLDMHYDEDYSFAYANFPHGGKVTGSFEDHVALRPFGAPTPDGRQLLTVVLHLFPDSTAGEILFGYPSGTLSEDMAVLRRAAFYTRIRPRSVIHIGGADSIIRDGSHVRVYGLFGETGIESDGRSEETEKCAREKRVCALDTGGGRVIRRMESEEERMYRESRVVRTSLPDGFVETRNLFSRLLLEGIT